MKLIFRLPNRIHVSQVLLVLAVLVSWWLLDDQTTRLAQEKGDTPHRPDFWATDFTTVMLDIEGLPRYQLTARKMVHFRDNGRSEFDHPDYVRFRPDQGPLTITATRGWNNEDQTKMVLIDDVVIISKGNDDTDSVTAEMDELTVYPEDDFAETSSPVKIIRPSGTTTGVGMEVNSRTGTLILLSNVRGVYESFN